MLDLSTNKAVSTDSIADSIWNVVRSIPRQGINKDYID